MNDEMDEDLDSKTVDSKIEAVKGADSKAAHRVVACSDETDAPCFEAEPFGLAEWIGHQIDFEAGHQSLGLENQTGHLRDLVNRIEWC